MKLSQAEIYKEIDGEKLFGSRTRNSRPKKNPDLCPELDMIGKHIADNGKCRYCGIEVER